MYKSAIKYTLVFLLLLLGISSCASDDLDKNPNTFPLMVMIDGKYYVYELTLDENYTVDDRQISGCITSVVQVYDIPSKNDEANFPAALNASYARCTDDEYLDAILIFFGGVWNLFLPNDS